MWVSWVVARQLVAGLWWSPAFVVLAVSLFLLTALFPD